MENRTSRRLTRASIQASFPLGRVLDVGCGSGRRVPEPFIPFGIEISRALFEQADAHMRGRGGWAVHAPALKGIGQFQTGYFSGIVLRSFLEHEVAPKAYKSLREFSPMKAVSLCECRTSAVLIGASLAEGGAAYATPTM